MLYLIGLGLGDEKDITLRGLEAVNKCEKVYMEAYTSLLSFGLSTDGLSTLVITPFFSLNSELILF
jgi:diphthine synthase